MTLGMGVFLGCALLAVVLLYRATWDRWRWKRIAFWSAAVLVVPIGVTLGWIYFQGLEDSRPKVQLEFWELKAGMTAEEVLFRKGKPDSGQDEAYWIYKPEHSSTGYVVALRNGKVRFVQAYGSSLPYLQGISEHSSSEDIESKFGKPGYMSISGDGGSRIFSYSQYGLTFQLEKNRVVSLGIFDPLTGPVRYEKEKGASSP